MQFVEAFKALGYRVPAPRTDWSADKADGICLSVWSKEVDWQTFVMDTVTNGGPIELWGHKAGNKKRIKHLRRALEEFDGWIDVVLVQGTPGESYKSASAWVCSDRKNSRWRVTFLEDETGHFRIEAQQGV